MVPIIPIIEGDEEPYRGKSGFTEGEHHFLINLPIIGSINLGCFHKTVGNGFHEIAHQKNIPWAQQARQNQCPERVFQRQVFHEQNIRRYHPSAEQGREINEEGHLIPCREVLPDEDEARHRSQQQRECGAGYSNTDSNQIRLHQSIESLENGAVGVEGQLCRPELEPLSQNSLLV